MRSGKSTIFTILCLVIGQYILVLCPQTALAGDDNLLRSTVETSSVQRIDEIDRSLVLAFIRLARFNIQFHQEANRHQNWRALTYPMGREAGTAVAFASSLIDLKQRVRGLDSPARISKNALRNALNTALVGTTISGSVSALELAQNAWVMLRARKHGYSPNESVSFVKGIVGQTETLFAERERLVSGNPAQDERLVFSLEALLLRRIRQQLLFEFATWSGHSRDQAWRENLFYGLDAAQNFTRASAVMIGLRAFGHPNMGGSSVICTLAANSAATVSPLICTLAGISIRNYQLKKLSKNFALDRPYVPPDELWNEIQQRAARLQKTHLSEMHKKLLEETLFLSDKSERLDQVLDRETREIERFRQLAQQQTISGPLIGLTGVAGTTMATIAFYDYRRDRVSTNHLLLANRISVMSGQTFALIYTPYTMLAGMVKKSQLKKRGELPSQLLAERLKNLDSLEQQIESTPADLR